MFLFTTPLHLSSFATESDAFSDVLNRARAVAERCSEHSARSDGSASGPVDGSRAGFPVAEFGWIADAGLLACALPRELGGAGLHAGPGTMLPLLRLLKHIGRGSLPVGRVYEGHINALQLIALFGSSEQLARAADDVHGQRRIFGVWNAEEAGGVQLVQAGDGRFRLEGSKLFCSGTGHVTRPIVTGRLPGGGWQMCLVPMDRVAPKIDHGWWQPVGMESTVSAAVDFTGIELGPDDLIGPPDAYYRDPWFNGGAIRFAAVQLGGAEALYDAARFYLQHLGRTDHPAQRSRASQMAIAIESGNVWLQGAAQAWERPPGESPAITAYAAMTRTVIEGISQDIMREVERTVGARGMMRPYPFGRMVCDLTMYLRQPAPDAVIERIGRHVLDDPNPACAMWPSGDTKALC